MAQTILAESKTQIEETAQEMVSHTSVDAFRLAPPPSLMIEPELTEPEGTTLPRRVRLVARRLKVNPKSRVSLCSYAATNWYDIGVALLVLASGATALYRLIWMGQP